METQMRKFLEESKLKDSDRLRFVLGGKSLFVVESLFTQRRLVFYVMKHPKPVKWWDRQMRFVYTRSGEGKGKRWECIGSILLHVPGRPFVRFNKSKISGKDYRMVGFEWVWYRINRNQSFENQVRMSHAGKCARCGRKLTDPLSMKRGFGPHCFRKVNKEEAKWLTK